MDPSSWVETLEIERSNYDQLRKRFIIDPSNLEHEQNGSAENARKNNLMHPLSLDENSPWSQFFQDEELRKIIQQDVDRTFTDIEYFRHATTKSRMTDMLFVYCKLNQDISYRQGMHELLALILWAVDTDALDPVVCDDSTNDKLALLIATTLNCKFVEHDTFSLFSKLMLAARQWYEFREELSKTRIRRSSADINIRDQIIVPTMPILRKAHKIHHEYLQVVDHELYDHLENLGIEPQIYAIRWLRLLFGREFPVPQVYRLWDALFADDEKLTATDFVCVAMLIYLRDDCTWSCIFRFY